MKDARPRPTTHIANSANHSKYLSEFRSSVSATLDIAVPGRDPHSKHCPIDGAVREISALRRYSQDSAEAKLFANFERTGK